MSGELWTIRLKAIGSPWTHTAKVASDALAQEIFEIVTSNGGFAAETFKLMCSGRYVLPIPHF